MGPGFGIVGPEFWNLTSEVWTGGVGLIWVRGSGFWSLSSGFWAMGFDFWVLDPASQVLGSGFWTLDYLGPGFWILGAGYWVLGLEAGAAVNSVVDF